MRVAEGSCLEPDGSSGRTLLYIRLSVKRTCTQYKRASSLSTFIGSGNYPRPPSTKLYHDQTLLHDFLLAECLS